MSASRDLPPAFRLQAEVENAMLLGEPVVALESTVITHGLPYPENLKLARSMEQEIRQAGAVPATIAIVDGWICLGLEAEKLEFLACTRNLSKISGRDIAPAVALKRSGGTTVAGTLAIARTAGLRVFATGGIGGVHRQAPFDISADLMELSHSPLVVICAGAKAILDLPRTLEMLETLGVPVAGYQTDEFPAFYSLSSGLPVSVRVDSPRQAADLAQAHWGMGFISALLLAQPPPSETALPVETVQAAVDQALEELQRHQIHGQAVTPFLLQRVSELTDGSSLQTNLALLRNNARLAAQVAICLAAK